MGHVFWQFLALNWGTTSAQLTNSEFNSNRPPFGQNSHVNVAKVFNIAALPWLTDREDFGGLLQSTD